MIKDDSENEIREKGWILDHDVYLFSLLYGEPFIENSFLYFWDGDNLFFNGWSINKKSDGNNLKITVEETINKLDPIYFEYWGPIELEKSEIERKNYKRVFSERPDKYNVNQQLALSQFRTPLSNAKRMYGVRKAQERNSSFQITRGTNFTWQHLKLIDEFIRQKGLMGFDLNYNLLFPGLFYSPETILAEVWINEVLIAFGVIRLSLRQGPVLTHAYINNKFNGTSDYLYYSLIQYYKSSFEIFDFGYSVNKNLYSFKSKWNININNGSYYSEGFTKSHNYTNPASPWWVIVSH
jgi:hypothetical protein